MDQINYVNLPPSKRLYKLKAISKSTFIPSYLEKIFAKMDMNWIVRFVKYESFFGLKYTLNLNFLRKL